MRRFLSLLLALVLVAGFIPASALVAFAEGEELVPGMDAEVGLEALDKVGFGELILEDFAGKKVSILGDSISTFNGISNNPSYNNTIDGSAIYYPNSVRIEVEETWWQQLIDVLDMELCVNNSWSGSAVFKERSGAEAAYINRCVELHNNAGETPDVILIYLGTNDFSAFRGSWGTADAIDYTALIIEGENGVYTYATPETVSEAYAIMLHKIQQKYPDALVYGIGLLAQGSVSPTMANCNNELKAVMEHFEVPYVELESLTDSEEEHEALMANLLHPKEEGMDQITARVIETMFGKAQTLYDISYSLSNVSTDNTSRMVLNGEGYEAKLTLDAACDVMDISVFMGGENITASCYEDGTITIKEVTGDVVITAKGYDTLEKAVQEASSSLIELHKDVTVEGLFLSNKVTLSLNGHTLNAKNVIVNNDNQIVDYTNGLGLLKVENNIALPPENSYLPVCNGDGGYVFVCLESYREARTDTPANNTAKFYFQPDMPDVVHDYLKAGSEASGVMLRIDLLWKTEEASGTTPFNYNKELIQKFYNGYQDGKYAYAFTMTVTGTDRVVEDGLSFQPYFESCGVKYMLH